MTRLPWTAAGIICVMMRTLTGRTEEVAGSKADMPPVLSGHYLFLDDTLLDPDRTMEIRITPNPPEIEERVIRLDEPWEKLGVTHHGMCAAVLPDTALTAMKASQFHRLPLPDRYTLCLAWSARNADTRPALASLIEQITERMAFVV